MTSKERIKKCLSFERPDRIGTYDIFLEETISDWRNQGLPADKGIEDYFGHDFQTVSADGLQPDSLDGNKFVSIEVCEPFSQACKELGLEETLCSMAYEPRKIAKTFNRITAEIIGKVSPLLEGPFTFDGVWLYGDLAYERGLMFSMDSYKRMLLPLHRELCRFFRSEQLEVIFHSHGDIRSIIPSLLDIGIRAIEPLETGSGLDIFELRRKYKKDLVLFGNIGFDKLKSSREAFSEEVEKKLTFLKKEGGYIYRMDKDITPDIRFDDYAFASELVRRYGDY